MQPEKSSKILLTIKPKLKHKLDVYIKSNPGMVTTAVIYDAIKLYLDARMFDYNEVPQFNAADLLEVGDFPENPYLEHDEG